MSGKTGEEGEGNPNDTATKIGTGWAETFSEENLHGVHHTVTVYSIIVVAK